MIQRRDYDVVVVGGGSAGVAAAASAAAKGARTLLVDAGPTVGGELISGIPMIGCLTLSGDWIVQGVARALIAECDRLGGYIGTVRDFRTLNVVAFDPEIMKLAVVSLLQKSGVELLLYTSLEEVVGVDGSIDGVIVRNKSGRTFISAKVFLDCSGDGDLSILAGADFESGNGASEYQALTLMFRMSGVETSPFLNFISEHPDDFGLTDQPSLGMSRDDCIQALLRQGQPKAAMFATGELLKGAIAENRMFPVANVAFAPTSTARKEVSINATRVGNVDATNIADLSGVVSDLFAQIERATTFLKASVPGFETAAFAGVAPRVGIRETRRIVGDYALTGEDVLNARRHADDVALGAHEVDIHGAGTEHKRERIKGNAIYGIPYRALIPRGLTNVLVAGRCLSSTREAQSSARVMGACMGMGQAIGTAAALLKAQNTPHADVRALNADALRAALREDGARVD